MNKPCLILSPAGTSLLTNCAENEKERKILRDAANNKENELSVADITVIKDCAERARTILANGNDDECKNASAEINGLLSYINQSCQVSHGYLIFIQTDTYLGDVVMILLQDYLKNKLSSYSIDIWKPEKLSTKTKVNFLTGINDIVKRCEENLPQWQNDNYHVVFNLTGGFKSVQGYLNTLGMLYADEIVYLFESSDELLRIPKLPISINIPGFEDSASKMDIIKYVPILALADKNFIPLSGLNLAEDLPEIFFECCEIDGNKFAGLTPWGTAVWQRIKKDMAMKMLYDLPYLEYADSFRKDFENFSKDKNRKTELLDALVALSGGLLENEGNLSCLSSISGIQYTPLIKSKIYDHFRTNGGDRVSCQKITDGKILLRHWGLHDAINDNQ